MRWLLILSLLAAAGAAESHLAPGGSGRAAGTEEAPFATILRARDAVRRLRQREPDRTAPVVVRFRGGNDWLASTVHFQPADAGTVQSPTVYEAVPGEEAILGVGPDRTGDYTVTVTVPGQQPATTRARLKDQSGELGWIRFVPLSKRAAQDLSQ